MALNPIIGTSTADSLTGTTAADSIVALAGNDTVSSAGSGDIVKLGENNDSLYVTSEFNTARAMGGEGNDTLYIGSTFSNSTLKGGSGVDSISIGAAITTGFVEAGAARIPSPSCPASATLRSGVVKGFEGRFQRLPSTSAVQFLPPTSLVTKAMTRSPFHPAFCLASTVSGGAGNDTISWGPASVLPPSSVDLAPTLSDRQRCCWWNHLSEAMAVLQAPMALIR